MVYLKDSKIKVESPRQVAKVFQDLLALEDGVDQAKEHFYCLHLDIRSRVNLVELVSLGSQGSAIVHPRETFRRAIMHGSASIIVVHNYPSGQVDPSDEDTTTTKRLFAAGGILGIALVDHIIFARGRYFSFKNNCAGDMDNTNQAKKPGAVEVGKDPSIGDTDTQDARLIQGHQPGILQRKEVKHKYG